MTGIYLSLISLMRSIMGIASRRDVDKEMYSASVVDNEVWVWSLEAQIMGHPA